MPGCGSTPRTRPGGKVEDGVHNVIAECQFSRVCSRGKILDSTPISSALCFSQTSAWNSNCAASRRVPSLLSTALATQVRQQLSCKRNTTRQELNIGRAAVRWHTLVCQNSAQRTMRWTHNAAASCTCRCEDHGRSHRYRKRSGT